MLAAIRVRFLRRPFWRRILVLTAVLTGPAGAGSFEKEIQPLLQQYCADCHYDGAKKGDLNLDPFKSEEDIRKKVKVWDSVMFNIDNWLMPPAKKPQPTPAERARLVAWIDQTIYPVDPANPDPGRVTIRRLNKTEYNNTMRDLMGVDLQPADSFPDDDSGYGFDNIGDVLALPPVLVERYLQAADKVLDAAIVAAGSKPRRDEVKASRLFTTEKVGESNGDGFTLFSSGDASFKHTFPADAEYILRFRCHADQAGDEPTKMAAKLDGKEIGKFDIKGTKNLPQTVEARFRANKGQRLVAASFLNDFYDGKSDRNLFLDLIEIEGPIWGENAPLPESHRRVFIQDKGTEGTEAATRKVLTAFCNRAFRRPARKEEIDRLAGMVRASQAGGASWEDAMKVALKASLISPWFLYRIEWQPEPDNPARIADLSEFALASRLSYFLWSSMPDQKLLSLAFQNQLRANLTSEVKRMIADPKARALAENFGGQWLEIRNLELVSPNPKLFKFDGRLRRAMRGETEEFFHRLLTENKSVLEFLSADYTYVNERLARHYGIENVTGDQFQKVSLDPNRRRGILTQASVLTVTSDPTRTSPVKRGKWVLENILGTPPPPPPPNVPTIESNKELTGSLRQKMEQHRVNPACANCHSLLDPIGFGLENFDAIGAWRDQDGGQPIESIGRLTTGQEFKNANELTTIILNEKRDLFLRCLTGKLLTFALGRGVEPYDKPAIAEILAKAKKDNYAFQSLIVAIGESVPFQKRRGDGFREPAKK